MYFYIPSARKCQVAMKCLRILVSHPPPDIILLNIGAGAIDSVVYTFGHTCMYTSSFHTNKEGGDEENHIQDKTVEVETDHFGRFPLQ